MWKLKAPPPRPKRKAIGPVDKLAPQGQFWKGLLASGVGAVVGGTLG